ITCLSAINSNAAPSIIDWREGGQTRHFEVATNEFYHTESGKKFVHGKVERGESLIAARARKTSPGKSADAETGYIVYEAGKERNAINARYVTRQILIEVEPGTDVDALLKDLNARRIDHGVVKDPQVLIEVNTADEVFDLQTQIGKSPNAAGRVKFIEPQLARIRPHRAITPNDTLFSQQWHLLNTGQNGGTAGIDVGLGNTWNTYRGAGLVIGIVDEGTQTAHPDLSAAILSAYGYDWYGNDTDPNPTINGEDHATSVAGVAAARGSNNVGVAGVAYEANIAAFRLTAGATTDAQEADAMTKFNSVIHIKNNSWGPSDNGTTLEEPGTLTQQAFADGCSSGRGGKGTIYVWAGGNGLGANDNSNYDGYANSIYTIAVCAISDQGGQASYSEPGANLVVGAPSSSSGRQGIVTTDRTGNTGYNKNGSSGELSDKDYTQTFGGTSSASPAVSGSIALILQANPNLGWRDVQEVLMRSATKNSPSDSDWITNAAGIQFNHKFGAG
ncbi:MAG TPA: S8 family serine peptidase, partial [Roseimicrobium sp.]|nr:S8 family serine peptidase [Roseimicrobium sp.]